MADTAAAVLVQWEEANSETPLGAAARPGHFERNEAGIPDYWPSLYTCLLMGVFCSVVVNYNQDTSMSSTI